MKKIKVFNKGKIVGNYNNIHTLQGRGILNSSEPMFILISDAEKITLDQGVEILLVYTHVENDVFNDLKEKSEKNSLIYLLTLDISTSGSDYLFNNEKIFGYSSHHDKVSFYLYNDSKYKVDIIFTTKESRESVHIALRQSLSK